MNQQEQLEAWHGTIDKVIRRASDEIFTTKEIQRLVADFCEADGSLLQGADVKITQCEVVCEMPKIGISESAELPPHEDPLDDRFTARVAIRAWPKANRSVSSKHWYDKFVDFLRAAWLPEVRERQVGLLDFKSEVIRPRFARTISRLAKQNPANPVYAVYIDLDRFKQINTELQHAGGDLALAHVGSCIQKIADEGTILGFRNGGDEFSLLVAGTPLAKLVNLLDRLNTAITAKTFGENKLTVGMTAGIATVAETYTLDDIDEAIKQAEIATKDEAGDKRQRGSVSLASVAPAHSAAMEQTQYAKLGTVLARACQAHPSPFANVILNIISDKAASCVSDGKVAENANGVIGQLINWLSISSVSTSYEENLFGEECTTSNLSNLDIAIAVYHGVARALTTISYSDIASPRPRFSLRYHIEESSAAVLADGMLVWGRLIDGANELDLGAPISISGPSDQRVSATVAFQVGFQTRICSPSGRPLPRCIFSDVVVVDDRPRIGGGLPDFWQAGVANIISAVGANRSFNTLLVVGDPENAPETNSRIKGVIRPNVDELAAITALRRDVVERCLATLATTGTIKYENNATEILEHLYASTLKLNEWKSEEKDIKREKAPKLKRTLDVGTLGLGALDGVKSESASQAYPAIIEIMRTSEAASMTFDDASQPLREIVGFKLVLDAPTVYPVPDYWSEQESAFEEYAKQVLLSEKGVISASFHEDGQYDAFIEQLADYCSPECSDKSTRRAILIVKNIVEDSKLRPLGLVSVWAAPRHNAGACSIEFSFVWRTVEALVGLPYSLYGSIKLSEQIIDVVKNKLQSRHGVSPRISAGRLTYLALSLHMRVDEFHKRIAKRIADAASV